MNYESILYSVLAILIAVLLGGLLSAMAGVSPILVYIYLIQGSIGTVRAILSTTELWIVLSLVGLSLIIPYKMKVWTLGAEGQMYMGALAATYLFTMYPTFENLILASAAALLFGGLWAAISGFLIVKFDADEIVTTLFMNYIAILITGFFVGPSGPLRDTRQAGNQSYPIPFSLDIFQGIVIVIVAALLLYFLITRTTIGYKIRAIGENPTAGKYAGIKKGRLVIFAMFIGGMLAGLGGMLLMMYVTRILVMGFSPGYGYIGIGISMLAELHPLAVIPFSYFFSILYSGGEYLNVKTALPTEFVSTITALILILSLLKNNFRSLVEKSKILLQNWQERKS